MKKFGKGISVALVAVMALGLMRRGCKYAEKRRRHGISKQEHNVNIIQMKMVINDESETPPRPRFQHKHP